MPNATHSLMYTQTGHCVADIIQAYGSEDLRDILLDILGEWVPLAAEAVEYWTEERFAVDKNNLCLLCRKERNCKHLIDKFEAKRNIKDMLKYLYGRRIVRNFPIKTGVFGVKLATFHWIGLAADIAQFALEYYGHTTAGVLVGAAGNTASGALAGSLFTGHPIGALVGGTVACGYTARQRKVT